MQSSQPGAGPLEVRQPRVRDRGKGDNESVRFNSSILPPYLRRSPAIDELIPWLYLKGISTGDFSEALQSLAGPRAKGLSPNVIVRLKAVWAEEFEQWRHRDLSEKAITGGTEAARTSPESQAGRW